MEEVEKEQPQNGTTATTTVTWVLKWIDWGHNARGWNVKFTTLQKWMLTERMNDMNTTQQKK